MRPGRVAAGAGWQCAPAVLIRPLPERLMSFVRLTSGLRCRAAPYLHREMLRSYARLAFPPRSPMPWITEDW